MRRERLNAPRETTTPAHAEKRSYCMKIELKTGMGEKLNTKVLVVPLFLGLPNAEETFLRIDRRLNSTLSDLLDGNPDLAKEGRFTPVYTNGKVGPECIVLAGLGENEKFTLEKIRRFGGNAVKYIRSLNAS